MNIVLIEPQIPQNTGNIARLCAATGSRLHLVGKLGFKTDDKYLKRAGLDYWKYVEIFYYENVKEFERKCRKGEKFFLLTTKGSKIYSDVSFGNNDYLIFGSETKGLPDVMREKYFDRCIKIPILKETRSLNLANSVGIVLYEALRQTNFASCQRAL
ncbi:MAG: tRNA (uridine(34)/cytosine(34)/5-carboxymethylaminomethyluridine(34)-2'-O)-methyltransferase TrmL [Proteobacteria bacterium]|nr:tRNA (uridine(34)/cytosine(34)/5-carboxymethylaminomethyluridine(34)-2'-O)-methyltransferase TrmL [Pseudomonadota bacterium]